MARDDPLSRGIVTAASLRARRAQRLFGMLARWALVPPLGRDATARVIRAADGRYVPPPPVARTRAGRLDVRLAAHLLALRDALVESGMPADTADHLLADATYRVMRRVQRPLDILAAALHPGDALARTRVRETLARRLLYRPPDWVMTEVDVPGCYAFDVHRCVFADYLRGRGEGPFCERVLCAQDQRLAEDRGQPLLRAGTLAGGADRCDFRYVVESRQGAPGRPAAPEGRRRVQLHHSPHRRSPRCIRAVDERR